MVKVKVKIKCLCQNQRKSKRAFALFLFVGYDDTMSDVLMPLDENGRAVPVSFLKTASTQLLDGTSASDVTTAFSTTQITTVLISAPEAFHIEIGTNPTATTSSPYIPAGLYELALFPNELVAIIKATASTAGAVWATPYKGN